MKPQLFIINKKVRAYQKKNTFVVDGSSFIPLQLPMSCKSSKKTNDLKVDKQNKTK